MPNNQIATFAAQLTGKPVCLNQDTEHFAVVVEPDREALTSAISTVAQAQLAAAKAWLETPLEADGRPVLRAFAPYRNNKFLSLRAERVKEVLGAPPQFAAVPYVLGLPLSEQRQLLAKLLPQTLADLDALVLTAARNQFPRLDLLTALEAAPTLKTFVAQLEPHLTTPARDTTAYYAPALAALLALRVQGWVMFPQAFCSWPTGLKVKWDLVQDETWVGPAFSALLKEIGGRLAGGPAGTSPKSTRAYGLTMVLMSSAASADDLAGPLIDEVETMFLQWVSSIKDARPSDDPTGATIDRLRPGYVRTAAQALRETWNRHHPDHAFKLTRTVAPRTSGPLRTSGDFQWLVAQNPAMAAWQRPLSAFVESRPTQTKAGLINELNLACDFFLSLEHPPLAPDRVDRITHIHDASFAHKQTLMQYFEATALAPKRRTQVLNYLREFFSWYKDWLHARGDKETAAAFTNPVSEHDRFVNDSSAGQTHRTALPGWLLREIRKTLTQDDFAFAKADSSLDWVNTYDTQTGTSVRVWFPGTSVCLAVMLDLPLRSHQARWLDSGVFDDSYYDPATGTDVKNPSPKAIKGRRQACLRLLQDNQLLEQWLGLFVNTNKTALYDGKSPVGYEIPYVSPELASLLLMAKDWQLRYMPPLAALATYNNDSQHKREFAKVDPRKMPKIAPLFLDPKSTQKDRPVSRAKVAKLWLRVLEETEKRIERERGVKLELTTLNEKGERVWKYDLHTLRVSGISAMIENGVPLEVVSQFVAGHASLVMTLWYLKFAPEKLRDMLEKARAKAEAEGDFIGGEDFMENLDAFSPFLLSQNSDQRAEGTDAAFTALKAHSGIWTVNTDGICPGTSCSTGGAREAHGTEYGPVPGGRRCGLCRYWITGPAFMLGQVGQANVLIYEIRKKGLELKECKDQLIDLEDSSQLSRARQMRHRIECMERELALDLSEWQSRYSYAMASSELLEAYATAQSQVFGEAADMPALLTANSADELRVTLQETDEFILLEHITQMGEVLPGFKSREAVQEKSLILSKVLAVNGLPPFLLTLDPKKAELAGNLFSEMLLTYVGAQDVPKVLSGEMPLSAIPNLKENVAQLAVALEQPRLAPTGGLSHAIQEVIQ